MTEIAKPTSQPQAPADPLKVTMQLITSLSARDMVENGAIRNNWIKTYQRITGRDDGEMKYEMEKTLFMGMVATNAKLAECDPFTRYATWMDLCTSGLSLQEGHYYIIPRKGKMVGMPGWRGRYQQLFEMPNIIFVHEPTVVYECDNFVYEKGEKGTRIKVHIPGVREDGKKYKLLYVYMPVEEVNGTKVYLLDRQEVYQRRAKSDSYKAYIAELSTADENGKVTKRNNQTGQTWKADPTETMWITDEDTAWKKTLVRYVYNIQPNKLNRHKAYDLELKKKLGDTMEVLEDNADNLKKDLSANAHEDIAYEEVAQTIHDAARVDGAPDIDYTETETVTDETAPPAATTIPVLSEEEKRALLDGEGAF